MARSIAIIAIIICILQFNQIRNLTKNLDQSNRTTSGLEQKLESTQSALTEANDQIQRANDMINDAKSSAWATYDDMGSALDDLEEVDAIDEP